MCSECVEELRQKELICPVCKRTSVGGMTHDLCLTPWSLDGLWSFGAYSGSLKRLIQKIKFRWVKNIAEELADLVMMYWFQSRPVILLEMRISEWVIVPVPLHPKRLSWRGFNQSALLGKLLAGKIGIDFKELLIKTRNTKSQAELNALERKSNLRGAFTVKSPKVAENILLIDDVWTTGATLKECCRVLKESGAKKVWAITLAR